MIDIYCLTAPSGRQYVGLASAGLAARWRSHVFDARHGSRFPLHAAIRKYGPKSFTREVLQQCETRAEAAKAEQDWIERLGTYVRRGGYNATLGGDGTHGLRDEARARIGVAHLGKSLVVSAETRAKISAYHLGRKRSAVTRARISEAHQGKRLSAEARDKLRAANTGKRQTEETKAKRAASMRAAWARRSEAERAAVGAKITAGKIRYPQLRVAPAWRPA